MCGYPKPSIQCVTGASGWADQWGVASVSLQSTCPDEACSWAFTATLTRCVKGVVDSVGSGVMPRASQRDNLGLLVQLSMVFGQSHNNEEMRNGNGWR